jgi:hypothetical protein
MIQLMMMASQFYLALVSTASGAAPIMITAPILAFVIASGWSYFSPMRLTGVDAVQSNGSQVALLGASTF